MNIRALVASVMVFSVDVVQNAAAQDTIAAGPFPPMNNQWRIDADAATPNSYEFARRVTGNMFSIRVMLANVPASAPVREMGFDLYFEPNNLTFAGAQCVNPNSCNISFSPVGVFPPYVRIITSQLPCQGYSGSVLVATVQFNVVSPTAAVTGLDVRNNLLIGGMAPACGQNLPADDGVAQAVIVIDPNGMNNLSALAVNTFNNLDSLNANLHNPDTITALAKVGVSLRSAIQVANAAPGANRITFLLPGVNPVIPLLSPLPDLNDGTGGTQIDGQTQAGLALTATFAAMTPTQTITSANNDLVNLVFNGNAAGSALRIAGSTATGNMVRGCKIGTNTAGDAAQPNDIGIIIDGANNNTIGGTAAADRNIIAGQTSNAIEIRGGAAFNNVQGNYIGLKADGTVLGNAGAGVLIDNADNNTVGGSTMDRRNFIGGNNPGVQIRGSSATSNHVEGNVIGLATDLTTSAGNSEGVVIRDASINDVGGSALAAGSPPGNVIKTNVEDGILVISEAGPVLNNRVRGNLVMDNLTNGVRLNDAVLSQIGGTQTTDRNVISGNHRCGVQIEGVDARDNVVQGNFIGTLENGNQARGNTFAGVQIQDGHDNTIGGCIPVPGVSGSPPGNLISSNGFDGTSVHAGVVIVGVAHDNHVQGNMIGINFNGNASLPNAGEGVRIVNGPASNVIGGINSPSCVFRNIISGNGADGVLVTDSVPNNRIIGNYIGSNDSGASDVGNTGNGVTVIATDGTIIGGSTPGERNVISGNNFNGVGLADADDTVIAGNYIGIAANGQDPLRNEDNGVFLLSDTHNNRIGGTASGQGNIIAFNGRNGIDLFGSLSGDPGSGNLISRNEIFDNTNLGIDLNDDGVTANDHLDPDPGADQLQNYPLIVAAIPCCGGITIYWSLDSTFRTEFRIEFFANADCDPSNYGEGESFIGSVDGQPISELLSVFIPGLLPYNAAITATAIDPMNNTSEFSHCRYIRLLGDVNGDGEVDVDDLLDLINSWGPCPAPPGACPGDVAPLGGNGAINIDDLLQVINGWGSHP